MTDPIYNKMRANEFILCLQRKAHSLYGFDNVFVNFN